MRARLVLRRRYPTVAGTGLAALAVVVATGALAGCSATSAPSADVTHGAPTVSTSTSNTSASSTPQASSAPTPASAVALLGTIPVEGRAPMTGYDRAEFGAAWTDDNYDPLGHNGCDTRNDILRRDLTAVSLKPGSHGCAVLTGTLLDPYTATTIQFIRGRSTSAELQIDHVVALGDAWQTGADRWTAQRRTDLANDPLELLAVDGPTNESKGDGDAATWLPPNKAFRCAYVARQVAVKARYGLWTTQAEHDAIGRVLGGCPGQTAPVEQSTPAQQTQATPSPATTGDVSYADCAAVRAADAAPIHRGDPGYSRTLDRNGDGVACE